MTEKPLAPKDWSKVADEDLQSINPKKESLTIEKLRAFPGFEHYSDEEAQEIVFSIQRFCGILYDFIAQEEEKDSNIESLPETERDSDFSGKKNSPEGK